MDWVDYFSLFIACFVSIPAGVWFTLRCVLPLFRDENKKDG